MFLLRGQHRAACKMHAQKLPHGGCVICMWVMLCWLMAPKPVCMLSPRACHWPPPLRRRVRMLFVMHRSASTGPAMLALL